MKQSKSQFVPGLGVLLLSAVLLGAVGYVLHDFRGPVWHLGNGALDWRVAGSFTLGTVYLSRVLLPLPDDPGWSRSFRLLWRSYFTGGVADMTSWYDSAAIMATPDRPAVAPSFDILDTGTLPAHEAVAIVRDHSYVRADGPGLIFLRPGESISQVIDLRPHVRRQSLIVNTRDGIPLDTSISVTFKVRSPAAPPEMRRCVWTRNDNRIPMTKRRSFIFITSALWPKGMRSSHGRSRLHRRQPRCWLVNWRNTHWMS
ncbi:MAG: SPFH domain-containing protein [Chloroflexota bacterium]